MPLFACFLEITHFRNYGYYIRSRNGCLISIWHVDFGRQGSIQPIENIRNRKSPDQWHYGDCIGLIIIGIGIFFIAASGSFRLLPVNIQTMV